MNLREQAQLVTLVVSGKLRLGFFFFIINVDDDDITEVVRRSLFGSCCHCCASRDAQLQASFD